MARMSITCLKARRVSNEYNIAYVLPLYKGKGYPEGYGKNGDISLLSMMGKVYAKMLIDPVKDVY